MKPRGAITILALANALSAQGPLNPTTSTSFDTDPTMGQFTFTTIDIPAGVTVSFTGSYPVQIRCSGDVSIHGHLSVDAYYWTDGPGAVTTGTGTTGSSASPGPGCHLGWYYAPGDGVHAGVYGSELPFDLAGGSPGGRFDVHAPMNLSCPLTTSWPGGGGGGTIALEADGALTVHAGGQVTAQGGDPFFGGGRGSGGSILLRSHQGLVIDAGASVLADYATPGVIRLDGYGQPPAVLGTVSPTPLLLTAPYLQQTTAPTIGGTWELRVAAPRGDGVSLATSFAPGPTTTPFGTVNIDLNNAVMLAFLATPVTGHDPLATFQLGLPNNPTFIGLDLYTAGLDWLTPRPPRVTNSLYSVVR